MKLLLSTLLILSCCLSPLYAAEQMKDKQPLRDPTQPPELLNEQLENIQPLTLNAIIISPNRRIAVINNTMHQTGEIVFGNKIITINSYSVQLEGVSGNITLFLAGKPIKQVINNRNR